MLYLQDVTINHCVKQDARKQKEVHVVLKPSVDTVVLVLGIDLLDVADDGLTKFRGLGFREQRRYLLRLP